jgi:hypothetical protein
MTNLIASILRWIERFNPSSTLSLENRVSPSLCGTKATKQSDAERRIELLRFAHIDETEAR